ncbi:beta-microseminoprotein-like [Pyxicephalus adspersus]|uniref:beta-microseminoprotein-like n=1 Tax=Pyxicephalus adspersus TaxID=30357 RepID=UPI003B5CD676
MKFLLALAFIACICLNVCNAACFTQLPEQPPKGCLYNGKLHSLGKSWRTKNCWDCSCDLEGELHCCQAYGTPVTNNENCKFRFDRKACKYILIENEDPEKKCTEYAMVG